MDLILISKILLRWEPGFFPYTLFSLFQLFSLYLLSANEYYHLLNSQPIPYYFTNSPIGNRKIHRKVSFTAAALSSSSIILKSEAPN